MARKVLIPEIVEPDESLPPDLVALRRFAYLMDEAVAIPGTGRRVGLDAAIGLIPGVGDIIAGLMSGWIVVAALRHRVPTRRILRMVFNIVADVVIGAVPVIGDVFDFLFEENTMNLQLLLKHRDRSRPPRGLGQIASAAFAVLAVIVAAGVLAIAAVIVAAIWLIRNR